MAMTKTKTVTGFLAGSFLTAALGAGGLYFYEQNNFSPDITLAELPLASTAQATRIGSQDGCSVYHMKDNALLYESHGTSFLASPRADFCRELRSQLMQRGHQAYGFVKPSMPASGPWPKIY